MPKTTIIQQAEVQDGEGGTAIVTPPPPESPWQPVTLETHGLYVAGRGLLVRDQTPEGATALEWLPGCRLQVAPSREGFHDIVADC